MPLNADFPLRGFITCGACGGNLTGAWSKGRNKRYAYYDYECHNKACDKKRQSISREKVHKEFEAYLLSLKPSPKLFDSVRSMFKDLWHCRLENLQSQNKSIILEGQKIEKKIEQLLDRIVESESIAAVSAYEKRIEELQLKKHIIDEKTANCGHPLRDFDENFRTATDFLSNPHEPKKIS